MLLEKTILLNSIMDYCQDIITVKDLNYNYLICNRAFLKFMHFFHESNVVGQNIKNVLPFESYDAVRNSLEAVILKREPVQYTFKINRSNEDKVISELSIPIVENGEITGILSVAKDITNEENLKLKLVDKICELNTLLNKKKQLESQKELFLTTLTHDLKNPVQAQLMSLKMLKTGAIGTLNAEQSNLLDILIESSNYMQEMLYSILRTYKYDNGMIELDKKPCDIGKLIEACVKEVGALVKERRIRILYKYKKVEITIDSEQIRRVIENLINNAINYCYKNTDINIQLKVNSDFIKFIISNYGTPIPENIKVHMFEKYATGNKFTGIGLGLYFSKKAIEAHGGQIKLETEGELSKFSFTIPLKQDTSVINW